MHVVARLQVRGLKEQLQKQLIEVQNSRTGLVVDPWLRVKGTAGYFGLKVVTYEGRKNLYARVLATGCVQLVAF